MADGVGRVADRPGAADAGEIFTPQVLAPTGAKLSRSLRSFTVKKLGRLMNSRAADLADRPRTHEMGIYKRYFDLIAAGRKTVEIRVNDSSRKKIKEGSLIRFKCRDDEVLTRVTRINRYASFEEMFDHEPVASVNPTANRQEQLASIRQIYPPEREALGVIAIGIELVDQPQ